MNLIELKEKIEYLKEFNVEELEKVKNQMEDFLFSNKYGVGLAAPQIGIKFPVILIMEDGKKSKCICLVNPEIVNYSVQTEELNEGCLSFPGVTVFGVPRSKKVTVKGKRLNKGKLSDYIVEYKDLNARIVQHEVDHLNGIEMFDRAIAIEGDIPEGLKPVYRENGVIVIDGKDVYTGEEVKLENPELIGVSK